MIAENNSIDPKLRKIIKETIPCDPKAALSRKISEWTSGKFSLGFQKFSAGFGCTKNKEAVDMTWVERCQVLENIILTNLDSSNYFIIFDELDEDYKYQSIMGNQEYSHYLNLVTSLFKAIQDTKSVSINYSLNINPIIFLRDDIYDLIQDPDKTKWSDLSVELKWTQFTIQPLIAHRLSRAIYSEKEQLPFPKVWKRFFENEPIGIGANRSKKMSIYNWISRNTLLRPRDYIKFLQLCAKKAYDSDYVLIKPSTVTTQDILYSSYFRSELVDEIHSLLPDINSILDIFSRIGKSYIPVEEFCREYIKSHELGLVNNPNYEFILKVLFSFSVIGNQQKSADNVIFRYVNNEASINMSGIITPHRGLYKSLQLL